MKINEKNLFKYFHFVQFLLAVGVIGGKRAIGEVEVSEMKRLVGFLEGLEIS